MDEQQGNVSQDTPANSNSAPDFFAALDNSVNSMLTEGEEGTKNSQITSPNTGDNTPEKSPANEEVAKLEKRYGDSSREAKRLNQRNQELEPYSPIIDAMRKDPNLIAHVRNYFEGGGEAPKSMTERLNLPEDFVFDPDEAFSKPDSDSSKLLSNTIDGIVKKRLVESSHHQQKANHKMAEESEFRKKHNMNDEEWTGFVDFAKDHKLELDDIYYLKNRQNRDNNIAHSAKQEVAEQMERVQSKPQSFASVGSEGGTVEKSGDDQVFDSILGMDSQLDNAFG